MLMCPARLAAADCHVHAAAMQVFQALNCSAVQAPPDAILGITGLNAVPGTGLCKPLLPVCLPLIL